MDDISDIKTRTGMRFVPGGTFQMGSDDHYRDERPAHNVAVSGFWIDETAVTNADFSDFVAATGYVTVAERPIDPADYPGADRGMLVPGSLVFRMTDGPVDLKDYRNWWAWTPGACWRHPEGPGSDIAGREDHPVVQVAFEDAAAYAAWAGKELPTEAEWEFAARGGLDGAEFAWGDDLTPGGTHLANTWQGPFPAIDIGEDGHQGLAPVGCYEPNGYGLYDMAGNVWEWTSTPFDAGGNTGTIRGGSYLCAPSYCARFRPAARQPQEWDFSASHIGFRTIERVSAEAG